MTSHSDNHVVRIIGHAPDEPVLGWSQHWRDFPVGTKFYTSPPKREPQEPVECMCGICKLGKREWQGLTDEEKNALVDAFYGTDIDRLEAIEALLKEKNQC